VWEDRQKGRRVYGARKVWRHLGREGITVARCTVERLMREMGIAGAAARRKKPRTTVPAPVGTPRPADLLERDFTADAPGRKWVADITYVEISGRFAYGCGSRRGMTFQLPGRFGDVHAASSQSGW
jgi:putative transposase